MNARQLPLGGVSLPPRAERAEERRQAKARRAAIWSRDRRIGRACWEALAAFVSGGLAEAEAVAASCPNDRADVLAGAASVAACYPKDDRLRRAAEALAFASGVGLLEPPPRIREWAETPRL